MNGKLYAVGGGRGGDTTDYLATVEAYDPLTDAWTTEPPISWARYFLIVAAIGNRLYAAGGGQTSSVDGLDDVTGLLEAYSPK